VSSESDIPALISDFAEDLAHNMECFRAQTTMIRIMISDDIDYENRELSKKLRQARGNMQASVVAFGQHRQNLARIKEWGISMLKEAHETVIASSESDYRKRSLEGKKLLKSIEDAENMQERITQGGLEVSMEPKDSEETKALVEEEGSVNKDV
jgi:hypothetical protein